MKTFIAIVEWSGGDHDKYQDFATKTKAKAHVAEHGGFVVSTPAGLTENTEFWLVDIVAETLKHDATGEAAASTAGKWAGVRATRDRLLAASDFTQLADSPRDKTAWAAYREKLRDLPASVADPDAVAWPAPPE